MAIDATDTYASVDVPCECRRCMYAEFRPKHLQADSPYEGVQSAEEARKTVDTVLQCVNHTREILRKIIDIYGAKLVKQWRRKRPKARYASLKSFDEGLCPEDHPFIRRILNMWDVENTPYTTVHDPIATFLPYLNLERISADSSRLLTLMYYRAYREPSEFVIADVRPLLLSWLQGEIKQQFSPGGVIITCENFGQWKELDMAEVHRGKEFGASKALLVLRAQAKLLMFLVGMAAQLLPNDLHGYTISRKDLNCEVKGLNILSKDLVSRYSLGHDTSHLGGRSAMEHYVQAIAARRNGGTWKSFLTRHESMPFLGPPTFDLDHLVNLTRDRFREAQDELWLLQTDPNKFFRYMHFLEKHPTDQIEGDKSAKDLDALAAAVNQGIVFPIILYADWHFVLDELEHLQKLRGRLQGRICPGKPSLEEYKVVLASLYLAVKNVQWVVRSHLQRRALSLPAFRPCLAKMDCTFDPETHILTGSVKVKAEVFNHFKDNKLLLLFFYLCSEQENEFHDDLPSSLHFLEQILTQGSLGGTTRADPLILGLISDLAVLEDIIIACDLHRPPFRLLEAEECCKLSRPVWMLQKAMRERFIEGPQPNVHFARDVTLHAAVNAIHPLDSLIIPHGPHDEKWLRKSQNAHAVLKKFWEVMEDTMKQSIGYHLLPENIGQPFFDALCFYKDPSHRARVQRIHESLREELQKTYDSTTVGFQFPEASPQAFRVIEHPPKPKTRGTADEECLTLEKKNTHASLPCQKPSAVLYPIKIESLPLLDTLFRGTDAEATRSTCDWTEFVAFMTQLGFGVEHRGGSKVCFEGSVAIEENCEKVMKFRSIVIHRPHPSSEMTPEMLYDIGRRCNRHFGWARENFVLAE